MNPTIVPAPAPRVLIGERHRWLNANRVASRLWMGARVPPQCHLRDLGFTLLVHCAVELPPGPDDYPGVRVLFAPNNDQVGYALTQRQLDCAKMAAGQIARHWREGGRVLVTCAQGRNRSGLVCALALLRLSRLNAEQAIACIRQARQKALTNPDFVRAIHAAAGERSRLPPLPHAVELAA